MRINAILTVIALLLAWPVYSVYSDEQTEDFVKESEIPLLFPGFSGERVRMIEIARRFDQDFIEAQGLPPEKQFETLLFVREREDWVLKNNVDFTDLKMDGRLIERDILEHLAAIKLDKETIVPIERVTEEFRREQQLTPETGMVITCMGGPKGPELARLILGKSTRQSADKSALHGYYVRRLDGRDVIIYEPKSQDWMLSMRASDWADKNIHEFLASEAASFEIRNAMGRAAFTRKGSSNKWSAVPELCQVSGQQMDLTNMQVQSHLVGELVTRFTRLRAEGFNRLKMPADDGANELEVRATLRDGTRFVLGVGIRKQKISQAVSSHHAFQFDVLNGHIDVFHQSDPKDLFTPTK